MAAAVPGVEGPHHRYALGIRGPDGKADPSYRLQVARMGAEALVRATVCALSQQPEVKLAQDGTETVGIFQEHGRRVGLPRRARPLHTQQVVKAIPPPGQPAAKNLATSQPLQAHHTAASAAVEQINAKGAGQEGMYPELPIALLHAQHSKGVRMSRAHQRGDVLSVQHSRTRLAGPVGRSVA